MVLVGYAHGCNHGRNGSCDGLDGGDAGGLPSAATIFVGGKWGSIVEYTIRGGGGRGEELEEEDPGREGAAKKECRMMYMDVAA